jgi:preprotein translocase subunit SecA
MNKQREVMYAERMKVIKDENVHQDIVNLVPDFVRYVVSSCVPSENKPETWDLEALNRAIELKLLPKDANFVTQERAENWDFDYLVEQLTNETIRVYEEKIQRYKDEDGIDFSEIERIVFLKNIDTKWIDHIDSMDQLRKGISLRGYGNVDPVVEYNKEGFEMFEDLTESIQDDTVTILLKAELRKAPTPQPAEQPQNLSTNRTDGSAPVQKRVAKQEIGRNDPCPCGSGKKYKNCCGKQ